MLAARRLPQILQESVSDGIEGMCLMTKEGSLLSSSFASQATIDEVGLAAISSTIWGNYAEGSLLLIFHIISLVAVHFSHRFREFTGNSDIFLHIVKLDNGYLGICSAGNGYLLAAIGKDVSVGLLKSRLQSLGRYFEKVFEQIK